MLGAPTVLSSAEEQQLEKYVIGSAKIGFPVPPASLKNEVARILHSEDRATPFTENRPGVF